MIKKRWRLWSHRGLVKYFALILKPQKFLFICDIAKTNSKVDTIWYIGQKLTKPLESIHYNSVRKMI